MKKLGVPVFVLSVLLTFQAKAIDLFDGWYWNSSESGWGVNVEVQGGVMFIAIFTYRQNGSPVWYYGSGSFNYLNPVFQTQMNLASGGPCFACTYQPPEFGAGDGGPITIDFDAPGGIEITWQGRTTNLERQYWAFGHPNDFLFGAWGIIRGLEVPFADWYTFELRGTNDSGDSFVTGQAVGGSIVVAQWFPQGQEYAMLDGKSGNDWYYEFVMNKESMIGNYWILGAGENPTGSGTEFVGYRLGQQEIPSTKAGLEKLWAFEKEQYSIGRKSSEVSDKSLRRYLQLKAVQTRQLDLMAD